MRSLRISREDIDKPTGANPSTPDTVILGNFLRGQGHFADEMTLLAIIRRMDLDGDANRDEVVAHHLCRLMAKFCDLREPQRAVVRLRAPPPSVARPVWIGCLVWPVSRPSSGR